MSKAIQHGIPGEWARVRGTVLSLWPLFLSFMTLGAFLTAMCIGRYLLVFAGLSIVSLMATIWAWQKGLQRVKSFFVGARGEERVAGLLALLPESYHVFHDFVAGNYHVDHVLVGPAGIFSIETKTWNHPVTVEEGTVLYNGHVPNKSPTAQCVKEADAVKEVLHQLGCDKSVKPVLCFASDTFQPCNLDVGASFVINANKLVAWINELPQTLSASELERIVKLLETR